MAPSRLCPNRDRLGSRVPVRATLQADPWMREAHPLPVRFWLCWGASFSKGGRGWEAGEAPREKMTRDICNNRVLLKHGGGRNGNHDLCGTLKTENHGDDSIIAQMRVRPPFSVTLPKCPSLETNAPCMARSANYLSLQRLNSASPCLLCPSSRQMLRKRNMAVLGGEVEWLPAIVDGLQLVPSRAH